MTDAAKPTVKHVLARRLKFTFKTIGIALAVTVVVFGTYVYINRGGEAGRLDRNLSRYFQLPAEKPSLATITDKNKLSSQNFFSQAKNGDKLLIFSSAHKVVLYRPSINKVVDIAPIQQQ